MKKIWLPAIACLFVAAPLHASSAAEVCPSGSGLTQSCIEHMAFLGDDGDDLVKCFQELKSEYFGVNGVAGKGPKYKDKKDECVRIARLALSDITAAYVPGGDTSPRDALEDAIDEWSKDE